MSAQAEFQPDIPHINVSLHNIEKLAVALNIPATQLLTRPKRGSAWLSAKNPDFSVKRGWGHELQLTR